MDFALSEEQEMLRRTARDFLEEKCPKTLVREMIEDEKGYPPALWQEMGGLGWMGLAFPESLGGSGMSFLDLCVLIEETGRACLPGPFLSSVVLGGLTILDAGSEEQKSEYLPRIASGEALLTLALNEADPRYDPSAIQMTATADGDDFVIDGTKLFVPDAHVADHLICIARTGEATETGEGLTAFIVDAGSPGLSRSLLKTISGDKLFEVTFDGVKVPRENVLGQVGGGWEIVRRTIQRAAVASCCELVGVVQRALELTLEYATERRQFGRPIGSFQVIQHYCVDMATDVDATRFVTYEAAWTLSEGLPCTREVAVAKAWAGEAYDRVVTLAHQIHGAIGCTIDHELQFYTKRGKAAQLSFGSGDFHRETVAQQMGL